MAAWRPLILVLSMLAAGIAMTRPAQPEMVPANGVSDSKPKSWGTIDGKSPFRLIADTESGA